MSNPMRQLEERHLATKVDLLVWSNKMDLLALSNAKGEVSLHRLSWQKVWSLSPPKEEVLVKGIAWRPDGKVIAIGYSNNDILLVNVENKDIIHKSNCSVGEESMISFLAWLEEKGTTSTMNQNTILHEKSSVYLPKLPPISRTYSSISEETNEEYEDTKKVIDQKDLNFLIIVLNNGQLFMSVFGLFACGVINLPENLRGNSIIASVEMSSDLKNIFVFITTENSLKVVIFDTFVLSSYCREIHALAYKYGQIMSLMDYLENTMHAITEAYENMLLLEMESKLSHYADSMPEGSVSADFLELLMFGITSDPLETFLLQDLTDKGIKKLSHSIELSHFNIQKLILKHLQAVGQNIAFHLSDLRGMARLTERFRVLGLDEFVITKSFTENGSFLVKASEVSLVIDDSSKKYKALFKWLYEIILRLTDDHIADLTLPGVSEQDISFIADYLYNLEGNVVKGKKKRCYLDHLGQYFIDQDLTHPVPLDKNPWEKFLEKNPCLQNNPSIIKRCPNNSLVQQYKRLQVIIEEAFKHPQKAIGDKITVSSVINLFSVPNSLSVRVSMKHCLQEERLIIAVIPQKDVTHFIYISVNVVDNSFQKCFVYFKSRDLEFGLKAIDLQIYTKELISVLLEQPGEERGAVFVQMPIRSLQECSVASHLPDKYIDGSQLVEAGALRPIDNMVACKLAVSGVRKVAVLLSTNMHKVRTYEMEVEEDEEEEDMETTRESENSSQQQSI
ncbi:anaphase-promoting complex subunit 4 [Cimex lectularius]|uniref:Anaphase-promoting complex subunit 4 n=1 Tax=Cimex lectularius TaxID=79782 RepID=A0A8I6RVN1_CIMLE|nr:anaphase-promoting complex subunit 4 [Cimex lectularius]